MTMNELLQSLDLLQYQNVFQENDLDSLDDCRTLTSSELQEMGISSLGHRKKLLAAFAAPTAKGGQASQATDIQPEKPSVPAATAPPSPVPEPALDPVLAMADAPIDEHRDILTRRVASFLFDVFMTVLLSYGLEAAYEIIFGASSMVFELAWIASVYFLVCAFLPSSPGQMVVSLRAKTTVEGANLTVAKLRHFVVLFIPLFLIPGLLAAWSSSAGDRVAELNAIVESEIRENTTTKTIKVIDPGIFWDSTVEKDKIIVPPKDEQASYPLLQRAKAKAKQREKIEGLVGLGLLAYLIFLSVFFVTRSSKPVQDRFVRLRYYLVVTD